jgi:hypothetical protein
MAKFLEGMSPLQMAYRADFEGFMATDNEYYVNIGSKIQELRPDVLLLIS